MKYDVLIIGGGMVGLVLAHVLARDTSLSIGMLEAQGEEPNWSAQHYHYRVSAISLASQRIFEKLDIWQVLRELRVSPFTDIHVWDSLGEGEIQFCASEIGEPVLGFIIENNAMQSVLRQQLSRYPQVSFISGVKLASFTSDEQCQRCTTIDGEIYEAKLIIGADGANSWLRKQTLLTQTITDYQQQAIVATVKTELPHQGVARQVFLPSGPLAFLPLAEKALSSIVWSVPTAEAKRLLALESSAFADELSTAFAMRLGKVDIQGQRFGFALSSRHCDRYIMSGLALIGDAAHIVHPLAGQGVNLGIQDAICLGSVIAAAVKRRRQFWSYATLRAYERERRAQNAIMLKGVDNLKALFASQTKLIQFIRSIGLDFINTMPVKNIFARYAAK